MKKTLSLLLCIILIYMIHLFFRPGQLDDGLQAFGSAYAVTVVADVAEDKNAVVLLDFLENFLHDFFAHCVSPVRLSRSASMAMAVARSGTVAPLALA